jgi:hypothetical protein
MQISQGARYQTLRLSLVGIIRHLVADGDVAAAEAELAEFVL